MNNLYIDEEKVQKFEQGKEHADNATIFSLLREFSVSQKSLTLLNTGEYQLWSKELKCPYFIFENGKYSFSSHAMELRSNLIKVFIEETSSILKTQSINDISAALLDDLIFLILQYSKALEKSIGVEAIYNALSKIKNFYTLEQLFKVENKNFIKKYCDSIKHAALNNPFFILCIFSQSGLYHLDNFGFTKKEIKDSMLKCIEHYNNHQPTDGSWA